MVDKWGNALKYDIDNKIDLLISALFHDLGKVKTTKENKKGGWSAYGHEAESTRIAETHKDWIIEKGGNFDRIIELISNHMKIKRIDEMRPIKQKRLKENPVYEDLLIFTDCDNMR